MTADRDDAARTRRRYTAVLIDDHELVLDGLRWALERDGWTVEGAFTSPQPAIQQLAERRAVDVVVIDLALGGTSGLTVLKALRGLGKNWAPVILTEGVDSVAATEALQSGARGFLLKDSPTQEIVSRLRAAAGGDTVVDGRVASALATDRAKDSPLTEQETTILVSVAQGMTNRQIGAQMYLSHYTVKEHLARVMRKLGTHRRAETVARAAELGLLGDPSRDRVAR
jgi:DNA-binding NarL/FixJ family response regulator